MGGKRGKGGGGTWKEQPYVGGKTFSVIKPDVKIDLVRAVRKTNHQGKRRKEKEKKYRN